MAGRRVGKIWPSSLVFRSQGSHLKHGVILSERSPNAFQFGGGESKDLLDGRFIYDINFGDTTSGLRHASAMRSLQTAEKSCGRIAAKG